jgi:hypothetical protein
MALPPWLIKLGVPEQCVERKSSASEHSRSIELKVPRDTLVLRVRVDNCWFSDSGDKKVDYLFCVQRAEDDWELILVELKGKDFGTALAQIERTLDRIGKLPTRLRLCRAAVVLSNGNRVPSYAKQVEQLRRRGILVTAKSQRLEMSV